MPQTYQDDSWQQACQDHSQPEYITKHQQNELQNGSSLNHSTGHCGLNKHLRTMKKTNTSECPQCGHNEETVPHFLGQCPATARGQYFQDYYLSVSDFSTTNTSQPQLTTPTTLNASKSLKILTTQGLPDLNTLSFSPPLSLVRSRHHTGSTLPSLYNPIF